MMERAFLGLWAGISGLLILSVQGALLGVTAELHEPEIEVVAEVIAIPPKPAGALSEEGGDQGTTYTDAACREHEGDYRNACFHGLALQRAERDPDGALQACGELPKGEDRWECFSDVAEIHSKVDRDWSEGTCPTIPARKWRDQCWFGIALAWSTTDADYARGTCDQAGQFKNFCRHDVNGEYSQVDPQGALDWCHQVKDFPKKWCYHGLGKYLGRTDPASSRAICEQVSPENGWKNQCYHGLGWALAEQDVDSALLGCRESPELVQDSCYMGVSANSRRFDAARSLEICDLVRDRRDFKSCVSFARGAI